MHASSASWLITMLALGACSDGIGSGRIDVSERSDAGRADAGMGQGGGDDDDPGDDDDDDAPSPLRFARFSSAPTTYALVNERYVYRPRSNGVALAEFTLSEAPAGMSIRRGQIEWTPTAEQGGAAPHRVTVRGSDGARSIEQTFQLTVATSAERGARAVAAGTGGTVAVEQGELRGAGVHVARGGLAAGARLSVSELSAAPTIPNQVGRARAVRFGPSGTAFQSPATIMLPLPEEGATPITHANLAAFVWNPEGRWQRVQVLAIDRDNHVMIARARHFSIYVAAQSRLALNTRLARAGADSACVGGVSAYAELASELETATLSSVNNLPVALVPPGLAPDATPVTALLSASFRGSLRIVHVFELVEPHDGAELARDQRILATTAYFAGDGSVTLTHTDALGTTLGSKRYTSFVAEIADIRARLRGATLAGHFAVAPNDGLAIAARVHLAYFEGDAAHDPVDVDALGLAASERGPVRLESSEIVDDADCDGLRDAFDAQDDRERARIESEPTAARTLMVGEKLMLRAQLVHGDLDEDPSWSVIGPSGGTGALTEQQGTPWMRAFEATVPGQYVVTARYVTGGVLLERMFSLDVMAAAPFGNAAPTCMPSKPVEQARIGEPIALVASVADAETPASGLRVRWGLVSGGASPVLIDAAALRATGGVAVLTPAAQSASAYTIGCVAFDGSQEGPIGAVSIPVVATNVNRPPEALSVTPALTEVRAGALLSLQAFARDPDGDPVAFQWLADGTLSLEPHDSDDVSGTRRHVRASVRAGSGRVMVTATDTKQGSVTLELPVRVVSDLLDAGVGADSGAGDAGTAAVVDAGGMDAASQI
ncbi:MAG: hypothetical protein ABW252_14420 [Polyangiales bacterium]